MTEQHETTEQSGEPASTRNAEPASPEKQKAGRRRKLVIVGADVVVLALVLGFGIPWAIESLNTVSTDDAFVNGHVTFVAPRVRGQVARVRVDDNNRVHRGDPLAELDKESYRTAVAVKKAAVDTAEADLKLAIATVRGIEAEARSRRWRAPSNAWCTDCISRRSSRCSYHMVDSLSLDSSLPRRYHASDTGDHLRPFLQHRGMAVTNMNRKVGVACTLQLAQPFAKRRPGAGDGHGADELGGTNLMLLRAQEHQVAAMVLQVARIGRLVALVDLPVLLHQRRERGWDAAAEIAELFPLDQVVQGDGRVRAGLRPGARAVERLTFGEHAAATERRDDSRCWVDAG
jgi:hypothetical protein